MNGKQLRINNTETKLADVKIFTVSVSAHIDPKNTTQLEKDPNER